MRIVPTGWLAWFGRSRGGRLPPAAAPPGRRPRAATPLVAETCRISTVFTGGPLDHEGEERYRAL